MAGAPKGNTNAAKGKAYNDALRRALARAGGSVDKGLNKITDQLVKAAIEGEQWAIREVADRIDGKPAQTTVLQGDEEHPLVGRIERHIINAANKDS